MRELLLGSAAGHEFALRAREMLRPRVAELVRRAQESGELRADLSTLDVPMIQIMLATVMDFTGAVAPETWRRVLGIVLDGLRADGGGPTELLGPGSRPGSALTRDGRLEGTRGLAAAARTFVRSGCVPRRP